MVPEWFSTIQFILFDHPVISASSFFEGRILPLISSTHPISATTGYRLLKTDMNIRRFKFILWNALVQTHTQPRVFVYFSVSCLLCTLPISFPINVVVKRIASAILSFNQEREFKKTRMFVNTATHPHNPTNRRRCNALIYIQLFISSYMIVLLYGLFFTPWKWLLCGKKSEVFFHKSDNPWLEIKRGSRHSLFNNPTNQRRCNTLI